MNYPSKLFLSSMLAVSFCLAGFGAASAAEYEAGEDYELITPPQPTSTGEDKVEVIELFWYGCPHCYQFEPYVQRWEKNHADYVEFVRMPGIFRPSWALHARAYYTAKALGVLDQVHDPLFEAIHELKLPLNNEAALADFFAQHGVDKDEFKRAFRSFTVETKVRRAMDMSRRYGANGVPTMIVAGKYRTSATLAGSHANTLKVVNYLAEKEKSGGE